jgi:hypothetical protein
MTGKVHHKIRWTAALLIFMGALILIGTRGAAGQFPFPSPAPGGGGSQPQTYQDPKGKFSIQLPAGWQSYPVQAPPGMPAPDAQFVYSVNGMPGASLMVMVMTLPQAVTIDQVQRDWSQFEQMMMQAAAQQGMQLQRTRMQPVQLGGSLPALHVSYLATPGAAPGGGGGSGGGTFPQFPQPQATPAIQLDIVIGVQGTTLAQLQFMAPQPMVAQLADHYRQLLGSFRLGAAAPPPIAPQPPVTPQPPTSPTPPPTMGAMKTFEDPQKRFSIQMPADMTLTKHEPRKPIAGGASLEVFMFTNQFMGVDVIVGESADEAQNVARNIMKLGQAVDQRSTTIGGKQGLLVTVKRTDRPLTFLLGYPFNSNIFVNAATTHDNFDKLRPIMEQAVTSLKVTAQATPDIFGTGVGSFLMALPGKPQQEPKMGFAINVPSEWKRTTTKSGAAWQSPDGSRRLIVTVEPVKQSSPTFDLIRSRAKTLSPAFAGDKPFSKFIEEPRAFSDGAVAVIHRGKRFEVVYVEQAKGKAFWAQYALPADDWQTDRAPALVMVSSLTTGAESVLEPLPDPAQLIFGRGSKMQMPVIPWKGVKVQG